MLYVYSPPNGGQSQRAADDGIDGFVHHTNARFNAYLASTVNTAASAFTKVGEYLPLGTAADVRYARSYSLQCRPVIELCRRLLTVRTEWSKK